MSEVADSTPSEPFGTLLAIAQPYDVTHGPTDALVHLTTAAVAATGADGGAVVSIDAEGAPQALTAVGIAESQAEALAAAAATVDPAADEPYALDSSTPAHAIPFSSDRGVRGALVLVGDGWATAAADGRRVAEVAADRAAELIAAARLREDLDKAMAQILEIDERMMGRIGLDIHDGPTQQLSVALLEVQLLEAELDDIATAGITLPTDLRPALLRIYETLGGALQEMRELIGHLRPAQFEDRALDDIVRDAAVAFEARGDATIAFETQGIFAVNGVSISQRITFYRVLQEALSNAARHGGATHIDVTLVGADSGTELRVQDNGAGFDDTSAFRKSSVGPQSRVGLQGMRDRAHVLGGTFDVSSTVGEGSVVRLYVPAWSPPERRSSSA